MCVCVCVCVCVVCVFVRAGDDGNVMVWDYDMHRIANINIAEGLSRSLSHTSSRGMYMCVCVRVCVLYVCMCVRTVCLHVLSRRSHTHTHTHTHTHADARKHTHMSVHTNDDKEHKGNDQ